MRILDLFCGGGGAARGILAAAADAGVTIDLTGIDIVEYGRRRQMARAYPGHFIQADALKPPVRVQDFDFVWASPPCQFASTATSWDRKDRPRPRKDHINLIPPTRALIAGRPHAIENVRAAGLRPDIILTGPMVGCPRIERERHFEITWQPPLLPRPVRVPSSDFKRGYAMTVTTSMSMPSHYYPRRILGMKGRLSKPECCDAMGFAPADAKLMTQRQLGEAVAPPFAAYVFADWLRQRAGLPERQGGRPAPASA